MASASNDRPLRRFWIVTVLVLTALLVIFAIGRGLSIPLLDAPREVLDRAGPVAALLGVGLLIGDVVLPTLSSAIMIAHGHLFGTALGALLNLVGSVGAAALGFYLGRCGSRRVLGDLATHEQERADRQLARIGPLAVIVTRPIPLAAEATAIMAGTTSMHWRTLLGSALLGSLPASLLYAWGGATAQTALHAGLVMLLVLALAAVHWLMRRNRT
mgnify:CR=1 FL=1|tara:strand:- start:3987 stop:4631 length:645 start_codon:yes stop_codon:yes gene_type:complete